MFWPLSHIYYRKERTFLAIAEKAVGRIEKNELEAAERLIGAQLQPAFAQLTRRTERSIFTTMATIDEGVLDLLRNGHLGKEYTSIIDGTKREIKSRGSSLTEIKGEIENAWREIR